MARKAKAAREDNREEASTAEVPAPEAGAPGEALADEVLSGEAIDEGLETLVTEGGAEAGPVPGEEAQPAASGGQAPSGEAPQDKVAILRKINAAVERARRRALRALTRQSVNAYAAVVEISIRDRAVWDAFLRCFVAVDVCATRLESELDLSLVGRRQREALAAQLDGMAQSFREDQKRYLEVARELAARLLQGAEAEELIVPMVEAPFRERVYVHSPISMKIVHAIQDADAMIAELETLRWNGLRRASEVNEERARIRRDAARIGRFAYRTTIHLRKAAAVVAARRAQPEPRSAERDPAGG